MTWFFFAFVEQRRVDYDGLDPLKVLDLCGGHRLCDTSKEYHHIHDRLHLALHRLMSSPFVTISVVALS